MKTRNNRRKFVLLVGDGMADYPLEELNGKTPLEVANTPNMDLIASGRIGLVRTIPSGMEPGSDIANLSLLGYDPLKYHTGRGPLEAAAMGLRLGPGEVAFRMNLVTLEWASPAEIIMVSHNSGNLPTPEGSRIIETLKGEIEDPCITIYPGISFRHLLVWEDGPEAALTLPPHDYLGQNVASYLNSEDGNPITGFIRKSWPLLKDHPVNVKRRQEGNLAANSLWPWGQGRPPHLPLFEKNYGLKGGVISAVDLLHGIGVYAGFEPVPVEGATGYLDTNYGGKALEALKALERLDFIFLHVEAPDEASHNGSLKDKIQAIEDIDRKVLGPLLEGLRRFDDYRVMVTSDHLTPLIKRTHSPEPAPFAWAGKGEIEGNVRPAFFSEEDARKSGLFHEDGHDLLESFLLEDRNQ
ncbi:MAG: cofactor-independent phosphoglycerate mutase [Deltaproteobacteria bacterium]|nr:cofactor-independent phosphoglycerate mutase [Deltaproteobacteria bacterium]MBW2138023.1 cofactor-independent phosphoglycerate mutase [Deltaproteobacteria bacterium]